MMYICLLLKFFSLLNVFNFTDTATPSQTSQKDADLNEGVSYIYKYNLFKMEV